MAGMRPGEEARTEKLLALFTLLEADEAVVKNVAGDEQR